MIRTSRYILAIYILLFSGLAICAIGQCLTVRELALDLQKLSEQADVGAQEPALQKWRQRWEHCQYPHDSTYINGLLQLGYAQFNQGNYLAATQVVKQAVLLSKIHRSDVGAYQASKALYRLGVLYNQQNQQDNALITLEEAIRKGQNIGLASKWVGNSHLYLSYTYYSSGDYQQALRHAETGESIADNLKDTILLDKLLYEKAKAYNRLKQYNQARQAAERTVRIALTDRRLATILTMGYSLLGVIEESQQQTDKALYYQRQAFTIARDTKDPYAPNFAVQLGLYYYRLGRYDEAIPYFKFGVDYNTDLFDKANSLSNLGSVYWKKKEFRKALTYYQQSLITMPIGFKKTTVETLPNAQSIRQASQKDYLLSLIQDKADTWLDYAKATGDNRQRLQYALDTYKIADQMIDYMRWEHTGQQSKLYWREKTRGMYERAIETCFRLGDAEQSFRFLEKSRALMLADKLNELGARQKLSRQQLELQERLQQAVSRQQSELASLKPADSTAYNSARMALFAKQDSLTTFLKKLEVSNPAYYIYKYDNATTSLPDLQRYLKKQQSSLITYLVGDSSLYLMGITGDTVVLRKQATGPYNQAIRQFTTLLNDPEAMSKTTNVRQFQLVSNSLYRQLLAPLALPIGRVVVSPDGGFIPFDALSSSPDKLDYAVYDYAFSYVYSASLLVKNRATQVRIPGYGRGRFLGVAPVDFSSTLKQVTLPNSDAALIPIAERFESRTILTHKKATRKNFLIEASTAQVIHLFTHATADSSDQHEPKLYFADSTLQLSELSDRTLPNAQLVVLAACKTGVGANQRGEGVFSLARGFAALGVPSVLTTLWSVQNDATYQLTSLFYKHLDEGLSKDIALQLTKQYWLKNADGVNQLPNYWAGLIIVGDTEPLPRLHLALWGSFLSVLLVAAGVIIWYERKKKRIKRPVSWPQPA